MEGKRYEFAVNTTGSCFICFEDVASLTNNKCGTFSFKNVCRYLDIKLYKIIQVPAKLLPILNQSDIKVSLCEGCGCVTDEFAKLYKEMEVIRMRLDGFLETIHQRMIEVESRPQGLQAYKKKMKSNPQARLHEGMVEKLRAETIANCHRKRSEGIPKVRICRLRTPEEKESQQQNSPPVEALPSHSNQVVEKAVAPAAFLETSKTVKEEDVHEVIEVEPDISNLSTNLYDEVTEESQQSLRSNNSEQNQPVQKDKDGSDGYFTLNLTSLLRNLLEDKDKNYEAPQPGPSHFSIGTNSQKEDRFPCQTCRKVFNSRRKLELHRKEHIPRKFVCEYCNVAFTNYSNLSRHKLHHCGFNPNFFDSQLYPNLREVLFTEDADSPPISLAQQSSNSCRFCFQNFSTKKDLEEHIKGSHSRTPRPILPKNQNPNHIQASNHVAATAPTPISIQNHLPQSILDLNAYQSGTSVPYQVPDISMSEDTNSNPEKGHKCGQCDRRFSTKTGLGVHINKTHFIPSGYIKYTCNICQKRFSSSIELQVHRNNVHHLGLSFSCPFCKKSFSQHLDLHNHQDKCPCRNLTMKPFEENTSEIEGPLITSVMSVAVDIENHENDEAPYQLEIQEMELDLNQLDPLQMDDVVELD